MGRWARRAWMAVTGASMIGLAAASALTPAAAAAPTVAFAAKLVAIKGFPHTGNIARAGTALKLEYTIAGTEYEGDPPPLSAIRLAFPEGLKVTQEWPTCPATLPEDQQPESCPRASWAGPPGELSAIAEPGGTEMTVSLQPVVVPGGLAVAPEGQLGGFDLSGPFAPGSTDPGETPVLTLSLPPASIGSGGPALPVRRLVFTIGSAFRVAGKDRYYLRTAPGCENPMHPDSLLTFARGGDPSRPVTVDAIAAMPCPRQPAASEIPTGVPVAPGAPPPCRSSRRFTIHIDPPRGVAYRHVRVVLDGRSVAVLRRGRHLAAVVDLRGLPKGTYAVKVIATTGSGRRIVHIRRYRTCSVPGSSV